MASCKQPLAPNHKHATSHQWALKQVTASARPASSSGRRRRGCRPDCCAPAGDGLAGHVGALSGSPLLGPADWSGAWRYSFAPMWSPCGQRAAQSGQHMTGSERLASSCLLHVKQCLATHGQDTDHFVVSCLEWLQRRWRAMGPSASRCQRRSGGPAVASVDEQKRPAHRSARPCLWGTAPRPRGAVREGWRR